MGQKLTRSEMTKKLESEGYKVYYTKLTDPIIPQAGHICSITKDKETIAMGISVCSLRDQYSTKIGKAKAFKRAVKALTTKTTNDLIKCEPRESWESKKSFVRRKIDVTGLTDHQLTELVNRVRDVYETYFTGSYIYKIYEEKGRDKINFRLPMNYILHHIKKDGIIYKSVYTPIMP